MLTQEQFDIVARHLLKQKKTSYDPATDSCVYRGEGKLKCAIGALIPDDRYRAKWEATGIATEEGRPIRNAAGLGHDEDSRDQACSLQRIHDYYEPEEWREMLIEFAARYELSTAVPMRFKA